MFDPPPAVPPAADLAGRLGALLREVTSERTADEVHAGIAELVSQPGHDPRLTGVADAQRFADLWAGLRSGSELPADAWQSVVLPTVLAFSNPQHVKTHLELATSLWVAATAEAGEPPEPAAEPEPQPEPIARTEPEVAPKPDPPAPPARPRRLRRALVAATGVALLAAAALWWAQDDRPGADRQVSAGPSIPAGGGTRTPEHTPEATGTPVTSAPTAGTPEPAPLSTVPVPTPTWSGPGPILAPTAPQALSVTAVTNTSVALSWRPPTEAGTGGIAYYRIARDGSEAGWTTGTSATVVGLAPQTRYTFTVTAYNGAGTASPPSGPVTATTLAVQPPPQTTHPGQPPQTPQTPAPGNNRLLATDPPQTPIPLGDSFTVTGAGWPCAVPAKIRLNLAGRPIATPEIDAEGAFRSTIQVDASQPARPTVAVIGSSEPLTLTRGSWMLTAEPLAPSACPAVARQSIQIVFR